KRTDIWAFGCVLYEMLTGKRAFDGEDVSDTLAAVLRAEPGWTAFPTSVPPAVRSVIRRCLEKNAKRRLRDIGDVGLLLAADADQQVEPAVAVARLPATRGRERVMWAAALVACAAIAAASTAWWMERAPTSTSETRLEITTPETSDPVSFALSPDGR